MQTQLASLVERYDALTRLKTERALALMSRLGQQVFALLPVLLHFNHPLLPGFLAPQGGVAVPHGIRCFDPACDHQTLLDDLASQTLPAAEFITTELAILGVYAMGSTASMGQAYQSDLDIWVCHGLDLPPARLALLEQKCHKLSRWAEQRGVDLNFFLIPQNKFSQQNCASVGGESCGSAQHLLLLDEFYRSALHIAGQRLLWFLLPRDAGEGYVTRVERLFADGQLRRADWLDLGGFNHIPAEEYFGSALWQLYKGIDSPYKSVLKLLLMEAYSHEYPHTRLLALSYRDWFSADAPLGPERLTNYRLDNYGLMMDRVTNYLKSIGDFARLDLVRRCFYLKVCDGVSDLDDEATPAWRRAQLKTLCTYWGWSAAKRQRLNNRHQWKIEEVKIEHAELLEALMHSYRNLIQFARRNNISESINAEDIGVLSRKLYAAFESLPGKVQRINLNIAPDLSEANLSFVQVPSGRLNRAGWYLYKHSLEPAQIAGRAPLEFNRYLSKLVAWAYFNDLLTPHTQVQLFNQGSDLHLDNLQHVCRDLRQSFRQKYPPATNLALSRPCELRHIAIFLNLERDPTNHWSGKLVEADAGPLDVFSFGSERECLIGSIDLVYRNSWSEIRTLHFTGEEAVVHALTTLLGKMHQEARAPETLDVYCYSEHFRPQVRQGFAELLEECIALWLTPDKSQLVKTLTLGRATYGIFFERRGVSVKKLENAIDFYHQISHNKLEHLPMRLDKSHSQHLPSIVDTYASEGLVQFFFDTRDEGRHLYILDEANRVEVYQHFAGDRDELVAGVNRFYTAKQGKAQDDGRLTHFNLPQFYDLVVPEDAAEGELTVVPHRSAGSAPTVDAASQDAAADIAAAASSAPRT
ncbi:MAG: class I adenylate cyclase [Aeromonas sp.]